MARYVFSACRLCMHICIECIYLYNDIILYVHYTIGLRNNLIVCNVLFYSETKSRIFLKWLYFFFYTDWLIRSSPKYFGAGCTSSGWKKNGSTSGIFNSTKAEFTWYFFLFNPILVQFKYCHFLGSCSMN